MIDINSASAAEIDVVDQLRAMASRSFKPRAARFGAVRQLEEVPGLAGKVAGLEDALSFG